MGRIFKEESTNKNRFLRWWEDRILENIYRWIYPNFGERGCNLFAFIFFFGYLISTVVLTFVGAQLLITVLSQFTLPSWILTISFFLLSTLVFAMLSFLIASVSAWHKHKYGT